MSVSRRSFLKALSAAAALVVLPMPLYEAPNYAAYYFRMDIEGTVWFSPLVCTPGRLVSRGISEQIA